MNLKYGYSFYPEHCTSKEELYRDIEIIKNSGANVVRMGEFCWDQLEPSDGEYNIDIIKEAVDILGNNGISSIICTPTSCPPSWLYSKYPEIAYIDYRGVKRPFGSRHSYCYNNEIYRKYSKRIVEKLGEVFGNNDNVIGFQIGNEFAQEGSGRCHCKVCTEKFRNYLEKKYETVQNLNQKCGTYFWGLSFNDFSHITPPAATTENGAAPLFPAYFDNPGIRINFERFSSDSMKEFSDIQVDTLKKFTEKPISSNSTSFATNLIDYYDFYEKADLYALDIYPELFYGEKDYAEFSYSFARNLKKTDFWILEFAIGGGHGLWAGEGLAPKGINILLTDNKKLIDAYSYAKDVTKTTRLVVCRNSDNGKITGIFALDSCENSGSFIGFSHTDESGEKVKAFLIDLKTMKPILVKAENQ